MTQQSSLIHAFAPEGVLRASINVGNPVLARRDPETGIPFGVSIDLAHELAKRLDVPIELVVWESAGKSVEAVENKLADVGFFAIDPKRGQAINFTDAYVLIEGAYLVKNDSTLQHNAEVDDAKHRITVGLGSAYDLYLSREIQYATLERAPTSPAVVSYFLEHGHEVAAGVKQQLQADAERLGGLRLLPGRFMVIKQAMGMHKERGISASQYLSDFVEEMKSSGFVAEALARHGIQGASVAPLSSQS